MSSNGTTKFWLGIIALIVSWLLGLGATYANLRAHDAALAAKVEASDKQLERMEAKIDKLTEYVLQKVK